MKSQLIYISLYILGALQGCSGAKNRYLSLKLVKSKELVSSKIKPMFIPEEALVAYLLYEGKRFEIEVLMTDNQYKRYFTKGMQESDIKEKLKNRKLLWHSKDQWGNFQINPPPKQPDNLNNGLQQTGLNQGSAKMPNQNLNVYKGMGKKNNKRPILDNMVSETPEEITRFLSSRRRRKRGSKDRSSQPSADQGDKSLATAVSIVSLLVFNYVITKFLSSFLSLSDDGSYLRSTSEA